MGAWVVRGLRCRAARAPGARRGWRRAGDGLGMRARAARRVPAAPPGGGSGYSEPSAGLRTGGALSGAAQRGAGGEPRTGWGCGPMRPGGCPPLHLRAAADARSPGRAADGCARSQRRCGSRARDDGSGRHTVARPLTGHRRARRPGRGTPEGVLSDRLPCRVPVRCRGRRRPGHAPRVLRPTEARSDGGRCRGHGGPSTSPPGAPGPAAPRGPGLPGFPGLTGPVARRRPGPDPGGPAPRSGWRPVRWARCSAERGRSPRCR